MFPQGRHDDHSSHRSQPDEGQKYETQQLHKLVRIKKAGLLFIPAFTEFQGLVKSSATRRHKKITGYGLRVSRCGLRAKRA
jgi:hypothetical protein